MSVKQYENSAEAMTKINQRDPIKLSLNGGIYVDILFKL